MRHKSSKSLVGRREREKGGARRRKRGNSGGMQKVIMPIVERELQGKVRCLSQVLARSSLGS